MNALKEIRRISRKPGAVLGRMETLLIQGDFSNKRLAEGLEKILEGKTSPDGVEVRHEGSRIGIVAREDLRELAKRLWVGKPAGREGGLAHNAAYGAAEGRELPGEPLRYFVELRCPVPGCDYRAWAYYYDPTKPPKCKQHKEDSMETL